jgi:Major Facilitator Superfamily
LNISAPFIISEKEELSSGGRARDLSLVPTFMVVAVDATGMGIILPLLPFYSQRLGTTPFLVGAQISVYAVCQLVAGPIVGILSERYGRRKVLLVSQIGTLAGFVVLALAPNLTLVFLARIIDGLTSGNISVAHAYSSWPSPAWGREGDWPAALKRGVRDQAQRFEACLASFARRACGRAGPAQLQRTALVLAGVPLAAIKPYLEHREPPPAQVDALITATYHAIVHGGARSNAGDGASTRR